MNKKILLFLLSSCYMGEVMATNYFVDPQSPAALWVEKK